MKTMLIALTILICISSTAMSHVCDNSWSKQNDRHVAVFRKLQQDEVKNVILDAFKYIGKPITTVDIDFEPTIYSEFRFDTNKEALSFATSFSRNYAFVETKEVQETFLIIPFKSIEESDFNHDWSVVTEPSSKPFYNENGDVTGTICSTKAKLVWGAWTNRQEDIFKFSVYRKANDYLCSSTGDLRSPDLSEVIQ